MLPEYVVTFEYQAEGRTYDGRYSTGWPEEEGHTFKILFDPKHPARNTGSDTLRNVWIMFTYGLGFALGSLFGKLRKYR